MRYLYLPLFIAFAFLSEALTAQHQLPDAGEAFVDTILPRVDIFIDPDTLDWIYENVDSYQEFHAVFIYNNGTIQDTLNDVGFRLRGNTSRYSAKKSFKVSFNTFESGRNWYGLEKLNLNGEHNDPSVARSKLGWDLLHSFNLPGARSNHVKLFINNNYHGLYINVEHIDEEFVLSRYGNNDGNLYKCLWPADLNYIGSNPENYKVTAGDRRVYDLKTNTLADDYSDLAHFIDVLNNTPDADFLCEIEKVFNIYDYIKIIAFDVFTANWDGYIYNQNNFYLYHNTKTDKFEYINYDLDNTFGIDWFGIEWATRDIYDWHKDTRPLYSRVMDNPVLRDQYSYYIEYFATYLIGTPAYTDKVNAMKWRNYPAIIPDPFYPLDYGYTHEDYLTSFDEALWAHVTYGIFPYITARRASLISQLESYDQAPVIKYIRNNYPQAGESLKIRATIDAAESNATVKLMFKTNGGALQEADLFDDGNHWDKEAGDGIYGCILPDIQYNTIIEYQVEATRPGGIASLMPCEPKLFELIESENPLLFINEFMASNESTIADEYGEYDDWIEVFNGDDEPIWLGDKFLTDNLGNADKWQMPDYTIAAGDFVLFWADDDPEQGDFHTNFKLDADGEEIGIFDAETTGFFPLDTLVFGPQSTDVSHGRKPDGAETWAFFTNTTPGYSNALGAIPQGNEGIANFKLYPNPVENERIYLSRPLNFTVYAANGVPVFKLSDTEEFTVEKLPAGLYFLVSEGGQSVKFLVR